jgi:glycosyltransferase involved in cell wall biosynthesis/SAM-dependent methyltransferase
MRQTPSLKVLLLTSSYPRNETDNSSIFLRYLAQNLAKNNVETHVLAPDDVLVQKTHIDNGVQTHWFQYLPRRWQKLAYGSGILSNLKKNKFLYLQVPFFLVAMLASLFLLCRKIKPAVIHAHWIIPQGFIAILVGKLLNIPVVTTAHGGDAFSLNNGLLSKLKKFTIRHCKAWTSNTTATAHAFGSDVELPKPVIIPMGVDIGHFQSGIANNVQGNESREIILFVGRLVEKKGVKYLLDAYAQLPPNTQKKSVLWIVGDGDERASLEQQAKQLNITKNIKFWGQVQNMKLPDFYAAASLFVVPSIVDSKGDTEGQGVILLEAMASKTPIIATAVGGIPEVIRHNETGLLVQANNPKELSGSIESLLNDNHLTERLTNKALKEVIAIYDWPSVSKHFTSLLSKVKKPKIEHLNELENSHRSGFSARSNRENKAKKISTILKEESGFSLENLSILDVGTGNGDIASYLGRGNNVVSTDVSDTRQNIQNFNFSICNEYLPFKSESFDIIISNHVIEHVHDQKQHISEIKRVLKKGGFLYLATPNRLWPYEVHYRLFFLHYLPQPLFITLLKTFGLYEEDVVLITLNDVNTLLGKDGLTSYSGKIIKNPKKYLMNVSPFFEKVLNSIPDKLLNLTTLIHPTFIFVYKKPHDL